MDWTTILYVTLAGVLLGVLLSFRAPILRFVQEVWLELKKASWPWDPKQSGFRRYKELIDSTLVVIVSSVLLGGYVTFADWILRNVVGALINVNVSA
ncbi:MAG: preprotein translocase subunit SecE [Verrucomicrobiota bacterium]